MKNYSRRNILGIMAGFPAGLGLKNYIESPASGRNQVSFPAFANALPPLKIKKVRAITTAPDGLNLIVVKVETSEPGLYGLGCATFTQRAFPVVTAIEKYMNEFCTGRDPDNIEDMWQAFYVSSYWRNDPVLNNAICGLDQALWDIKGKRADMPVYQLLGGKCRFAVDCYGHASGPTPEAVADSALKFMDQGFRHVRIQQGGTSLMNFQHGGYGGAGSRPGQADYEKAGFGMPSDTYMDDQAYLASVPAMFDVVRKRCGEEIDLIHDIHERCQPMDVINMCRKLEQYRPMFIEDPLSPENAHWWKQMRKSTSVPFAMGELFNNINEFVLPMSEHYYDYIRVHVSQIGGITPAMKIARLGEWFNVKTAWHGPGDVSPVGHAANAHMDLAVWNFGIQEAVSFSEKTLSVFSGCPEMKNGYMHVNEAPGLGVDINEKEAAKYPINNKAPGWTVRKKDGTILRP